MPEQRFDPMADYGRAYARGLLDGHLGRYREGWKTDQFQRIMPGIALSNGQHAAYRDGWIDGQAGRLV